MSTENVKTEEISPPASDHAGTAGLQVGPRDLILRAGLRFHLVAERYRYAGLVLFSIVYFAATIFRASRKLFWFDEIFTIYMSRLDLAGAWHALVNGADGELPLLYQLTRLSEHFFGSGEVGVRMPEIIAFWVFCLCLFRFVSSRSNALAGFVSLVFPLVTEAYWYSYDARAHALVLCGAGISLVCWQAAASRDRARFWPLFGLSVSIGASLLLHAYAILIFVPIAAGELARLIMRRRPDWPVWLSVAAVAPISLIAAPLLSASRGFRNTLPARVDWLFTSYPILFHSAVLVIVTALILICFSSLPGFSGLNEADRAAGSRIPLHESIALFGCVASLGVVFTIARVTDSPMLPRYALIAVFGVAALLGHALARKPVIGAIVIGLTAIQFTWDLREYRLDFRLAEPMIGIPLSNSRIDYDARYKLFESAPERDLPIVLMDGIDFAATIYYAPPSVVPRLAYLPLDARDMTGFLYSRLIQYAHVPGRVLPIRPFIQEHARFLAYGLNGYCGEIGVFERDGASIKVLSSANDHWLYLVEYAGRR